MKGCFPGMLPTRCLALAWVLGKCSLFASLGGGWPSVPYPCRPTGTSTGLLAGSKQVGLGMLKPHTVRTLGPKGPGCHAGFRLSGQVTHTLPPACPHLCRIEGTQRF